MEMEASNNAQLDQEMKIVMKQMEGTFIKFNLMINDAEWIYTCTTDDIKTAFKLANIVERAADIIHRRFDYLRQFLDNLANAHVLIQLNKTTYFKAGDTLLLVFLRYPSLTVEKLDLAINMYLGFFPPYRFEMCIADELTTTSTEQAIVDFLKCNVPPVDADGLKSLLFLKDLARKYPSHPRAVREHIKELLSNYRIVADTLTGSLQLLLRVVGLKVSNEENNTRNIIIELILERMYDRSILSKPFWIIMFKEIDDKTIMMASTTCMSFLNALCCFIIYIGSMMEKVIQNRKIIWCANPNTSICPEITYKDLVRMCKLLYSTDTSKDVLHSKIVEARLYSDCSVWLVIEEDLEDL